MAEGAPNGAVGHLPIHGLTRRPAGRIPIIVCQTIPTCEVSRTHRLPRE